MQELDSEDGFDSSVGDRVRTLRRAKGWSQKRLAEAMEDSGIKIDPTAITRIEGGARELKLREALAIADALGSDIRELVRIERSPRDELESLLDATTERRTTGRAAFAGMGFYYTLVCNQLRNNPELLEQLSFESGRDVEDISDFLRIEAEMAAASAREEAPKFRLGQGANDEEIALIAEIAAASLIDAVSLAPAGDDGDDPDESEA